MSHEVSNGEVGVEPDVSGKSNVYVLASLVITGISILVTIAGFTMYFKIVVENERYVKYAAQHSPALAAQRQHESDVLSGKLKPVGENEKSISLETAKQLYLRRVLEKGQ